MLKYTSVVFETAFNTLKTGSQPVLVTRKSSNLLKAANFFMETNQRLQDKRVFKTVNKLL